MSIENEYFSSDENIRAYYNVILQQLINFHDTIWEEIKHFTWLLSVLLSAPFVFLLGEKGETLFFDYGWIPTTTGFFIALIGVKIIHRESQHFLSFAYYLHRTEWILGLYQEQPFLKKQTIEDPHIAPKDRQKYFSESEGRDTFVDRNNRFRITSIRWLFIILFLIYAVIGLLLSVWILIHKV